MPVARLSAGDCAYPDDRRNASNWNSRRRAWYWRRPLPAIAGNSAPWSTSSRRKMRRATLLVDDGGSAHQPAFRWLVLSADANVDVEAPAREISFGNT